MRKIILSLFLALIILVPNTTVLAMSSVTNYIPDDSMFFINANLSSITTDIKKLIDSEMQKEKESITNPKEKELFEKAITFINTQLGKDIYLSIHPEAAGLEGHIVYGTDVDSSGISFIQEVLNFECERLETSVLREEGDENNSCIDLTANTIFSIDGYSQKTSYINLDNKHIIFDLHNNTEISLLTKVQDIFKNKEGVLSLAESSDFKTIMNKIDQDGLISMYVNYDQIIDFVLKTTTASGENEITTMLNSSAIKLIKGIGFSIKKNPDTIVAKIVVSGNTIEMDEQNQDFLSLNKQATYKLYKNLPIAPVIAYHEQSGLATNFETAYAQIAPLGTEYEINEFETEVQNLETLYGITRDDLKKVFDSNAAIAIQQNNNIPIPYFTVMADTSNDPETAKTIAKKLIALIDQSIIDLHQADPETIGQINNEKISDTLYKITLSEEINRKFLSSFAEEFLSDIDGIVILQDKFDGYAYTYGKPINIYYGILPTKNVFVFSNAEGITNTNNTNIADSDLWAAIDSFKSYNTGITYLSPKTVSNYIEAVTNGVIDHTGISPSIEFFKGYYSVLEVLNYVPKIIAASKAEKYFQETQIVASYNTEKKISYENFIKEYKANDSDNDGLSDYDEKFIYFTNPNSRDSDGDDIIDSNEITMGSNPHKPGKTFDDITETEWYAPDLIKLNKKGSITGYQENGKVNFDPSRHVNRAEFIKMVLNAFDVPVNNNGYSRFDDVNSDEWYADYANTAYSKGYISGKSDPDNYYSRRFDGAATINRAEAIHILSNVAKLQNYTSGCASYTGLYTNPSSCEGKEIIIPFADVTENDYFADSLKNAYELNIIKGKSEGTYAPADPLSRAEAARMISRTMEVMTNNISEQTELLEDSTMNTGSALQQLLY